jgi:hypothetical protein
MPQQVTLRKAELLEVRLKDGNRDTEVINRNRKVTVQFNPETLKVTFSNTLENQDQRGSAAMQFVSKSNTKLTVQLWFDVTVRTDIRDVRELTGAVNYFVKPGPQRRGKHTVHLPPAVRFAWGTFLFDGVMESVDETLEFFSAAGRPLRANVSITIVSQDIQFQIAPGGAGPDTAIGTQPQRQIRAGETLQDLSGQAGRAASWPQIAAANGVEDPRNLQPGSFINLNLR